MDIKTWNTGRAAGLHVTLAPAMVVAVCCHSFSVVMFQLQPSGNLRLLYQITHAVAQHGVVTSLSGLSPVLWVWLLTDFWFGAGEKLVQLYWNWQHQRVQCHGETMRLKHAGSLCYYTQPWAAHKRLYSHHSITFIHFAKIAKHMLWRRGGCEK